MNNPDAVSEPLLTSVRASVGVPVIDPATADATIVLPVPLIVPPPHENPDATVRSPAPPSVPAFIVSVAMLDALVALAIDNVAPLMLSVPAPCTVATVKVPLLSCAVRPEGTQASSLAPGTAPVDQLPAVPQAPLAG